MPARATPLLWLFGPSGVGKSTVGWEVFTRLYRRGTRTGYIDLDQMGLCYPQPVDDPDNHRIKAANLGAVWATYRDAGARCLIGCGGAERAELVPLYLDTVPDTAPTLVRLRAGSAVLRERIFRRGRGEGPLLPGNSVNLSDDALERMASEAAAEGRALDEHDFADACIDTEQGSVAELADLVLAHWPLGDQ